MSGGTGGNTRLATKLNGQAPGPGSVADVFVCMCRWCLVARGMQLRHSTIGGVAAAAVAKNAD